MFDRPSRPAPQHATTLTSAAHGGPIAQVPRSSRLTLIVAASAVVVGSTVGTALALRSEPSGAQVTAAAPPSPAVPSSVQNANVPLTEQSTAVPAANPPPADPRTALTAQIQDQLQRFVAWSHDHSRARCPELAALGGTVVDPWGHAMRLTCTDQPGDQIAGVISPGPDGVAGTRDDIASWALGPEVTEIIRGARWTGSSRPSRPGGRPGAPAVSTAPAVSAAPAASTPPASAPPSASPAAPPAAAPAPTAPSTRPPVPVNPGGTDTDGDGIPDRR